MKTIYKSYSKLLYSILDLSLEEIDLQKLKLNSDRFKPVFNLLGYLRPTRIKDPFLQLAAPDVYA